MVRIANTDGADTHSEAQSPTVQYFNNGQNLCATRFSKASNTTSVPKVYPQRDVCAEFNSLRNASLALQYSTALFTCRHKLPQAWGVRAGESRERGDDVMLTS